MLTRGRFVCHVNCLVHDGVVRSSPCGPHHENFGRNLYHMFVPAYSASQSFVLFWVVVFELLRSQMLIPYLPKMVFSYSYVNINPSRSSSLSFQFLLNRWVSLQVDPIIFNIRKINSKSSKRYLFHPPKFPLFSHRPSLCFFKDSDFFFKYPFIMEVPPFYFLHVLIRWFSWSY